jgi:hypothetical protein
MIYDFSKLRPRPSYPTYPSYHRGLYLEDYFFDYFLKNKEKFDQKNRILLPISWTTLYVENTPINIQEYINVLNPDDAYLAVSQHDDGIKQRLPPNTLHFAAGGLGGGIPIPLICSPIPNSLKDDTDMKTKDILCSFVGSITHPIRRSLYETYNTSKNFQFGNMQPWSQSVSDYNLLSFCQASQRSRFTLAPRGYGLSSFRLYEIFQLNSIPVYVSDKHWLPFADELNWEDFCVIINDHQIPELENILLSISDEKQKKMLEKGKQVWDNYFTLKKTCEQILKRI